MDESTRWFAAQTLLLKIHAITGWTIPVNEMLDILIDQFQRKLEEGYANVTLVEVEYAFRHKDPETKDWGKALNLSMIDEVMLPYLQKRIELSRMEEGLVKPTLSLEEAAKVMTDEDWDTWLLDIRTYDFRIFPTTAYDYLVKKGEITLTDEEKHAYMGRAIAHLTGVFDPLSQEGIDFIAMKNEGVFNREITGTLKTIAKRFALQDYFNTHPLENQ